MSFTVFIGVHLSWSYTYIKKHSIYFEASLYLGKLMANKITSPAQSFPFLWCTRVSKFTLYGLKKKLSDIFTSFPIVILFRIVISKHIVENAIVELMMEISI